MGFTNKITANECIQNGAISGNRFNNTCFIRNRSIRVYATRWLCPGSYRFVYRSVCQRLLFFYCLCRRRIRQTPRHSKSTDTIVSSVFFFFCKIKTTRSVTVGRVNIVDTHKDARTIIVIFFFKSRSF